MAKYRWKIEKPEPSDIKRLEYALELTPMTAAVMAARGIVSEADAQTFLSPAPSDLSDPMLLPDAQAAVERLLEAVSNDEHIVVLGHDDADGITATTIVFGSLREIGADVSYYIPDSPTEGLGLSRPLIDRFKAMGVTLIITVDCGVSCREEAAYASGLGIDTIITDHHEPPAELPPAVAVIDPKRADSKYGFRELAGCGVAYRFMEIFVESYRRIGSPPSLDGMLGMAALGTFADRVPLVGENRVIVHNGVRQIANKKIVPFRALRSHIWVDGDSTMTEILSKIVPLIGASRSSEGGNLGVELLLATEDEDAEEIFGTLVLERERKKEKARRAFDKVMSEFAARDFENSKVIAFIVENLPDKTVGFCASRISDDENKPVLIIALKGDKGIGECRAPKGVDLVEALSANKDLLLGYGGHKQAAGFSIDRANAEPMLKGFTSFLEAKIDPEILVKEITIEARVRHDDMQIDNFRSLMRLEPFGECNPRPVFMLESLDRSMLKEIEGQWRLGEVAISGEDSGAMEILKSGEKVNLAFRPFSEGSVRLIDMVDFKKSP
ncbi:MAG: DHH family phosphoesterase [bacterium]|jgi:single-stranded-DNA-specific exonuclease